MIVKLCAASCQIGRSDRAAFMSASLGGESPTLYSFCGTPCPPTAVPPLPLGSIHYSAWEKPKPAHQNAPAVPPPPLASIAPMVLCGGIVATHTSCSDSPSDSTLIQIWYQLSHRPAVLGMESGQDQLQAIETEELEALWNLKDDGLACVQPIKTLGFCYLACP